MSSAQVAWHWIDEVGLDPLWTIAAASLATSFFAYRPAKAFWFAALYRWDFNGIRRCGAKPSGGQPRGLANAHPVDRTRRTERARLHHSERPMATC